MTLTERQKRVVFTALNYVLCNLDDLNEALISDEIIEDELDIIVELLRRELA